MRPIDADAMRQDWLENGQNEYVYDTNAVLDSIDAQPTIDVEPVRHGRWIERSDKDIISMTHPYVCNLCGRVEMMKEPYCNCGAKMDLPNQ